MSRRIRWLGHIAHMGEMRKAYRSFVSTVFDWIMANCMDHTFLPENLILSCSWNSPPFMEFEGLLPHSQELSTRLSRGRWIQSTYQILFSEDSFNIILSSLPRPPKWSLPFMFSDCNYVCISHLTHACYMPQPYHHNIWWSLYSFVQPLVTSFHIHTFSSALCSQIPSTIFCA